MTVLLYASCAVTVKLKGTLLVAPDGAATSSLEAAAAFTVMPVLEPVIDEDTVSVAVMDCDPAVFNVKLKLPTPFVRVVSDGSDAWLSELVK